MKKSPHRSNTHLAPFEKSELISFKYGIVLENSHSIIFIFAAILFGYLFFVTSTPTISGTFIVDQPFIVSTDSLVLQIESKKAHLLSPGDSIVFSNPTSAIRLSPSLATIHSITKADTLSFHNEYCNLVVSIINNPNVMIHNKPQGNESVLIQTAPSSYIDRIVRRFFRN